ncbi:SMI1/KNR4 family protein [Chitinophaga ginsengisoli]|uniref:Cell wall assembly regulator SMI1 n=1 Tax=Chitinophaga ginsengisoli TaxID=363837 RepID=A0A2P8GM61_9BACT|nr:SMI1/KNR4 family protein [Chitinophaga ginsengisoli]PSL35054.1 cell wall assembly regulator SMI1 [Chitinophaga ginsengisoli]
MEKLIRSYEQTYGKPDTLIALEAEQGDASFHVAVKNPMPDQEMPESTITSLGLSGLSDHDVELNIDVNGKQSKKVIEATGAFFYKFHQELITADEIVPGSIYRNAEVPEFDGMKAAIIINKGYLEPEWLDHEKETGKVMTIVPLFDEEADELERLPIQVRELFVRRSQLPVADPKRKKDSVVRLAVKRVWQNITEWYKAHKEKQTATLTTALKGKKTDDPAAALEKELGIKLPEDFRHSFDLIHERIVVGEYTLYDEKSMVKTARDMNGLNAEGAFKKAQKKVTKDTRIQQVWWHEQWIPVAVNSYNDRICIDMAPGPAGIPGQVIMHYNDVGPDPSGFECFFQWLEDFYNELRSELFEVNEHGEILKK